MDKKFWNFGIIEQISASSGAQGHQRKVMAYDIRGHGRAADAPITTSLEQLANDLRELCAELQLSKIDVGGISYGGVIAQQFVLDNPSLVRSALFIGTLSKGAQAFQERAVLAEEKGMEALYEPSLTRWFLPKSLEANTPAVQYVRKQLELTKVANWAAIWRILSSLDFTAKLKEIEVPALCLACKEDTSTPPALLKNICELVQNGTYVEVYEGMHFFPLEVPHPVADKVVAFLDQIDGRR